MRILIIIILGSLFSTLLITYSLDSQTIVWEREFPLNKDMTLGYCPIILDSDSNLVCTLNDRSNPCFNSHFFKYNPDGQLISHAIFNNGTTLLSLGIKEVANGYSVFNGSNSNINYATDVRLLPLIINTDRTGNPTNYNYPYDIKKIDSNISNTFGLGFYLNNTVNLNDKYYNIDVKNSVNNSDGSITVKNHVIFNCYDSNGMSLSRFGYDTLSSSVNSYILKSVRLTKFNTLLVALQYFNRSASVDKRYSIKILELDTNGLLIKRIEIPPDSSQFTPVDIQRFSDGSYIILNEIINVGLIKYNLLKLDKSGSIVDKKELPVYNLGLHLLGISIAYNDDFIIYGETLTKISDTGNPYENKYKLFLSGYDRLFNKQFNIEWNEHLFVKSSYIQNLLFLDNNNFIIVGNKDNVSFYIARLNKLTSNIENLGISNANFIISPNPATDFIEISAGANSEPTLTSDVKIYNVLGEIQTTPSLRDSHPYQGGERIRIDVSGLAPGMYFIRIGDRIGKLVKN